MKVQAILITIILVTSTTFAMEDSKVNRERECERYLKSNPPEEMMQDMADKMAMNLPPDKRQKFKDMITKHLDMRALKQAMREGLIKHYTADEIKALTDFYESPVGKSAMKKTGDYMAEIMPTIRAEGGGPQNLDNMLSSESA